MCFSCSNNFFFKQSPKKKILDQNVNDSKSRIQNSFSANVILGIQIFYIRPHVAVDIIRIFLKNFRFYSRKSQTQQELAKKITRFTIQFPSKNTTHFINVNSTHLTLKICQRNTQPKTFPTLQIFQQIFLCLVSEKNFALHYFLTPKNCILEEL